MTHQNRKNNLTPAGNVPPTVIITGPTAAGKTDLSLELARYFQAPIISADSRQCYKYLNIGTAKVPETVRKEIPHYHVSTLYPDQSFTAADFASCAKDWRREIRQLRVPVLVVGGSTLYIESLIRPLDPLPPKSDTNIRELSAIAESEGLEAIHSKLMDVDPEYARRLDGLNPHRMYRALDVWMQTGKPFSSFHKNRPVSLTDNTLLICLYRDRNELHQRINQRVDLMLRDGLLEEVKHILGMGYTEDMQSLQTVGYRESMAHIHGSLNYDGMQEKIKTNTRRYARRQMTWFRRWSGAKWINLSDQSTEKILADLILRIEQLAAEH